MPKKDIRKEMKNVFTTLIDGPPRIKDDIFSWNELVKYCENIDVKPREAFKIIRSKVSGENIRFNWKMIRFTLFVWERLEEYDKGYLKPKIDTIRKVVSKKQFRDFYFGYFPETTFDEEKEIKLLNKLVAEKPQRKLFTEGYYYYYNTSKIIPQEKLDKILWEKNK